MPLRAFKATQTSDGTLTLVPMPGPFPCRTWPYRREDADCPKASMERLRRAEAAERRERWSAMAPAGSA